MEHLKDFFQDKQVDTLLDVGTGSGDFLKVLKEVFPNTKITGIDPSINALKKAREEYLDVNFKEMGGENLKFPDASFKAVSISMALHHLPDIQKTFSEMIRVIKPGGWIIISELFRDNLNPAQEVHKMYHHFRSTTDRILGISHNETFKKEAIIQMVENSGIYIQFHFEFLEKVNRISGLEDLEMYVDKMKQMLEEVKDYPEYDSLKPKVGEFRERASKFGFQPATRVVVIGKVK